MQSGSGAVRLLLFETKHVKRKIDTMGSSESEFEEETLLLYALYHRHTRQTTAERRFWVRPIFSRWKEYKQVYSLIASTNFSSCPSGFSSRELLAIVKLTLDPRQVAVSFELYVGLRRNRTQVYSQRSYAGSDRRPAV